MAIDVSEPSIDAFAPVAPPTTPEHNLDTVEMTINMGPQHPSTHGVFRMVLQLAGERVQAVEPFIGYLHRGAEKLGEAGDVEGYRKAVIWLDRTDYLSVWPNEHCYMLCLEKLAGIEVPERAEYLRVILSELGRVNSHCMFYGAFGADAGATTPFMYAFALREELYSLFEAVGGARMFPNYFRPGGLREDVPADFVQRATKTVDTAYRACDEFEALLTTNEIFLSRTRGIGVITRRAGARPGPLRPRPARHRDPPGHPPGGALLHLRPLRLRRPGGHQGRLLRALPDPPGGDAPEPVHRAAGPARPPRGADHGQRPQGDAPAQGRRLPADRERPGGLRRVPRLGRAQPGPLPGEVPLALLRQSAGAERDGGGGVRRGRRRSPWGRSTSSSARSTGERRANA